MTHSQILPQRAYSLWGWEERENACGVQGGGCFRKMNLMERRPVTSWRGRVRCQVCWGSLMGLFWRVDAGSKKEAGRRDAGRKKGNWPLPSSRAEHEFVRNQLSRRDNAYNGQRTSRKNTQTTDFLLNRPPTSTHPPQSSKNFLYWNITQSEIDGRLSPVTDSAIT